MYINEAAPAMVQPLLFCRSSRNRKKVRGAGNFVTTQVVVADKKQFGWVLIMGGMMPSVRKNLAHKRCDYRTISWLQNLNVSFPQRRFPFFPRTFPATRARGSRDLRPRVAGNLRCRNGNPRHENGKVRPGNGFTPFSSPYRQGSVNESGKTGPDSRTPARCTRIHRTCHHSLFTLHPICYAHH